MDNLLSAWWLAPVGGLLLSCLAGVPLCNRLRRTDADAPYLPQLLLFVLPFVIGGFFTYLCALVSGFLLGILLLTGRRQGFLTVRLNWTTLALLAVFLGYCITPLWAADKGMAGFAAARFLPVLLYGLLLLQLSARQRAQLLALLPLCGAFMTVLALALAAPPATRHLVTVDGRLSGFFDYPNSFALFLLLGLALQGTKAVRRRRDWLLDGILLLGILASGSRTVFVLLLAVIAAICILRRSLRFLLMLGAVLAGTALLGLCLYGLGLFDDFFRFLHISKSSGSLLLRLLYMKDALPVILRNPFGLGYWGYRATLGSFQTGRYAVTFVHNGLLQLLLDVGWVPAGLLCAAVGKTLFSKKTGAQTRLLLLVLLGHSLFDFNFQYLIFWLLLLSLLDFEGGRAYCLKGGRRALSLLGGAAVAVCLWLGVGDYLLETGRTSACLSVTPFCTQAQIARLAQLTNRAQRSETAEQILRLNDSCAAACDARASAAFSDGDILLMTQYSEQAIRCNRYDLAQYCRYFDMLFYAGWQYNKAGDKASGEFCRQKLLQIPVMLAHVAADTDPLARKLGDQSDMTLPALYLRMLAELQNSNSTEGGTP